MEERKHFCTVPGCGCNPNTRGQASVERSIMERKNIYNHKDYHALSAAIHCQNTNNNDTDDHATINAKLIFGKYTNGQQ